MIYFDVYRHIQFFLHGSGHQLGGKAMSRANYGLITCRTENQLIGIAPCFIDDMGVVRGIGCEDVTDYFDFIIDPQYLEMVLHSIVQVFVNSKSDYNALQLCNFGESSPILQQLPKILADFGLDVRIEQQEVCPIIDLPHTWDDYLAQLPKKQTP